MNSGQALHTRYSSDEEDDLEEEINVNRMYFNEALWDALAASKSGDSQTAIMKYHTALKIAETTHDIEKICLVKRYELSWLSIADRCLLLVTCRSCTSIKLSSRRRCQSWRSVLQP